MTPVFKKVSYCGKRYWYKDLASKQTLPVYHIIMSHEMPDTILDDVLDTVYRKMKDEANST